MFKTYHKLFTKNKIKHILFIAFIFNSYLGIAQQDQKAMNEQMIKKIYTEALQTPQAYSWLEHLCTKIGSRLSGSEGAAKAVEYTAQMMKDLGAEVRLQKVMVPHWVRGDKEVGKAISTNGNEMEMKVCALGNAIGTGPSGLKAPVIEVNSFEQLTKLGEANIKGKIVFYNYKMDVSFIETFDAYGKAGEYRFNGSSEAAKLGAVGTIVRSLTTAIDDFPHTGSMRYQNNVPKIPAFAISTKGAEHLSKMLKEDAGLQFYLRSTCQMLEDVESFNVIADLKGTEFPDQVILVGGHLDSWDLAQGAHDDGTGCVQAMEVLRIFKALNIKPKRTIRMVLFMNEENGLRGGQEYAKQAKENTKEKHIAAIESDSGGFTPRGFSVDNGEKALPLMQPWVELLNTYHIHSIDKGYGGADIGPMKDQGTVLIGFRPDSQRYFDYHHTAADTFEAVHQRELELGAAAITSLVYLIDQQGL